MRLPLPPIILYILNLQRKLGKKRKANIPRANTRYGANRNPHLGGLLGCVLVCIIILNSKRPSLNILRKRFRVGTVVVLARRNISSLAPRL